MCLDYSRTVSNRDLAVENKRYSICTGNFRVARVTAAKSVRVLYRARCRRTDTIPIHFSVFQNFAGHWRGRPSDPRNACAHVRRGTNDWTRKKRTNERTNERTNNFIGNLWLTVKWCWVPRGVSYVHNARCTLGLFARAAALNPRPSFFTAPYIFPVKSWPGMGATISFIPSAFYRD